MQAASPISVSFVVCCHNSEPRLEPTLTHLAAIEPLADQVWEVVVVDNASTDNTAAFAEHLWAALGSPAPLRVASEPQLGLIHARQRGIAEARHEVLSFVDDDNWISPRWLQVLNRVFRAHPDVGVVGALGTPTFDDQPPAWFESIQHCYACGPQADFTGPIAKQRPFLYGAGASFRARALQDLAKRGFSARFTGRQGGGLMSGEDSEITMTLSALGWVLWYDEELRFEHYMPPGRLTTDYAKRLLVALGELSALIDAYLIGLSMRSRTWNLLQSHYLTRLSLVCVRYAAAAVRQRTARTTWPGRSDFFRGRLKAIVSGHAAFKDIIKAQQGWRENLGPSPRPAVSSMGGM